MNVFDHANEKLFQIKSKQENQKCLPTIQASSDHSNRATDHHLHKSCNYDKLEICMKTFEQTTLEKTSEQLALNF